MKYNIPSDLPVILITYNRPDHTKQVLDALRLHGIQKLFIYSDAPKTIEAEESVNQTRELFHTIDWTVPQITYQKSNCGLAHSICSATDEVFKDEDFVVLLEDDCVPERWFFRFMLEVYKRYKDHPRIFGASGYTVHHPKEVLQPYPYDLYFFPRIGSWGWGTWKEKWAYHNRNLEQLLQQCQAEGIDLEQGGTDVVQILQGMIQGTVKDVWTIHWILSVYLQRGFYIYPTHSHVRNIGMDGSGVHCGVTSKFDSPIAERPPASFPDKVILDNALYSSFRSFYDVPGTGIRPGSFEELDI